MRHTALLLTAGLLLGSCTPQQQKDTTADEGILLRQDAATSQMVVLSEQFTSEIRPYRENDITPAATGVHIDRIMVDVGDAVQKGQLIVKLDPTQYNQQCVQLRTIEDDYNRLKPVFDAGGISRQQIDQAKARLDMQREVVDNLRKNIEVHSPITGVVTARNYESGDLFAQKPVLHIMQIDPLKIVVNISEQYFPAVKVGMEVTLSVDIFPEERFTGRVELIHPALDPTTRTFTVEVRVENRGKKLRPGMYAQTLFEMGEKQGTLVSDVAIRKQVGSSERYLYVIKGDTLAERRRVEVGRQVGDRIDILSGVEAGEQIAITGLSKLYDGAKVRIEK